MLSSTLIIFIAALCGAHSLPDATMTREVRYLTSSFDEIIVDGSFDLHLIQPRIRSFSKENDGVRVEIETTPELQRHIITKIVDGHILYLQMKDPLVVDKSVRVFVPLTSRESHYTIKRADEKVTKDKVNNDQLTDGKVIDERAINDEMTNDQLADDKVPEEKVTIDKVPEEKVTIDKMPEEKVTNEKLVKEKVTKDKVAKEKVTKDEVTDETGISKPSKVKVVFESHGTDGTSLVLDVDEFEADISGTADSRFSGNVRGLSTFKVKGTGNVNALKLISQKVIVDARGVGTVRVAAKDDAQIKASGIGNVFYKLLNGKKPSKMTSSSLAKILPIA